MLQNPDPQIRIKAVTILGGRRRPRAAWLLQRTYQNDPNPQVRELARTYLAQWAQNMLTQLDTAPAAAAKTPASERLWECEFCGAKDVKGGRCPSCGAPRPDDDDED
jgi:hypothetical protein